MRMISERDSRIMSKLARHAGNDLRLVEDAIDQVGQRPRSRDQKIPLQDVICEIERLRRERQGDLAEAL
jgi:hypothetical protein